MWQPRSGFEGCLSVLRVSAVSKKMSSEYSGKQVRSFSGDDMFSQALFFPSLVLTGSGGQFLLMCLLACLQDLIAAHQA